MPRLGTNGSTLWCVDIVTLAWQWIPDTSHITLCHAARRKLGHIQPRDSYKDQISHHHFVSRHRFMSTSSHHDPSNDYHTGRNQKMLDSFAEIMSLTLCKYKYFRHCSLLYIFLQIKCVNILISRIKVFCFSAVKLVLITSVFAIIPDNDPCSWWLPGQHLKVLRTHPELFVLSVKILKKYSINVCKLPRRHDTRIPHCPHLQRYFARIAKILHKSKFTPQFWNYYH